MRQTNDLEIKADIMNRLLRRRCWGAKYLPSATLINWLSKKVKKNGKRVQNAVDQLVKEGYLISHKKGTTVSLNPMRSSDIVKLISMVLKIQANFR